MRAGLLLALVAVAAALPLDATQDSTAQPAGVVTPQADPMTANLTTDSAPNDDLVTKDQSKVVSPAAAPLQDVPMDSNTNAETGGANLPDNHYPLPAGSDQQQQYAIREKTEKIAAIPIMDETNKTLWGVQPENRTFDYTNEVHPMEDKTPLSEQPCDSERVINVVVKDAEIMGRDAYPTLPKHFGCSDEYEGGREKASPEISWSNVTEDVVDFSLQLVSMGDASCPGWGADAGKILWHVTGIKAAPSVTLPVAASHDSRLLKGGKEEPNQWLEEYYSGPCPKPGVTECYRFKVLAHRANGRCQCGHADVLFTRPDKQEYQPWTYTQAEVAPVGAKKD